MRGWRLMVVVCLAALAPSAWLAWEWRTMPHLGIYHDDSLYCVAAKGLAEGDGYRLESFPGRPAQTKYPPLLPLLLSAAWRIQPAFPGSLPAVMAVSWLVLPLFLAASGLYFRQLGFGPVLTAALTAWLALNPVIAAHSLMAMAELPFAALLVLALVLAERSSRPHSGPWTACLAGLAGAAAFLAKTAALPLLATAPLCLALSRRFGRAVLFAAAMGPAVVGWQIWTASHAPVARDAVSLYYLDYSGFYRANIGWRDLPAVVWENLNAILTAGGKLLCFFDESSFGAATLGRVLTIGAVAGVIRVARRTGRWQFPAFAAAFLGVLATWHYVPEPRFLVPVAPLMAAGLAAELEALARKLGEAWKRGKRADRAAAVAVGVALALLGSHAARQALYGLRVFLPSAFAARADAVRGNAGAYEWIRTETPPEAKFFAYDDPGLYLHTGRKAMSLRVPPILVRRSDDEAVADFVASLPEFAAQFNLDYALFTPEDFRLDAPAGGRQGEERLVAGGKLMPVYRDGRVGVFAFRRDGSAGRAAAPPGAMPPPSGAATPSATLPPRG